MIYLSTVVQGTKDQSVLVTFELIHHIYMSFFFKIFFCQNTNILEKVNGKDTVADMTQYIWTQI